MNEYPANPAHPGRISWLSWSTEAFQRAHAGGRPVLLSIVTAWSAACAAMEREVFADPTVAAAVEAHAVPVRVDADKRPDIADRYGLGGWPTTVWLTPDGEMLTGGTYLDAGTLVRTLGDVRARFQRDRATLVQHAAAARAARAARRQASSPGSPGEPETLDAIRARILNAFDSEFGGFGRDAKYPLAAPLRFALHAGVGTGDTGLIHVAETTLDRIISSAIGNAPDGAFHRACATREWTDVDPARLLEVQADMIVTYLDAWRLLRHDRYRTRALAALDYVDRSLRDGDAFNHSEAAPLIVTESNARMLRALVHASHALDDTRWLLTAVGVAERLLPLVYVRASGVAHYLQHDRPHVFGLLAGNVLMASALLDIGEAAGQHVYIELAEELTRSCLRRFWDTADPHGGFVDRIRTTAGAGDVGLLGEPLKPFAINADAARLLLRLAARTDDATLAARAREAVSYVAVTSPTQGILSSECGLLLMDLGDRPLWYTPAAEGLVPVDAAIAIPTLKNIATQLRIDSVKATSEAGSGHPTSCCSAAEIVASLFFSEMRFDPTNPQAEYNDRFILSKGHAAPVLYAAWAEVGFLKREDLLNLRMLHSDLEGHPTPRLPFADVATGSLGQGICAAVGIALNARRIGSDYRTYALLGDGESAEGSVWEAAEMGEHYQLDNLCGITDMNRLGQSRPTQLEHNADRLAGRWEAFGWHAIVVDGHDIEALLKAYADARATKGRPTMIVAKTLKGKGISFIEGKDNWHGKALKKGEEMDRAIKELEAQFVKAPEPAPIQRPERGAGNAPDLHPKAPGPIPAPDYKLGDSVATREAYGTALVKLGAIDPRIVVLDADVGNSTFSEKFEHKFPDRFFEAFIAEQIMVGAAMGLASRGAIPFPSTFAVFLSRAADFLRMTGISHLNVKFAGSHVGVSIGEDGPSQMGLEDLAMARAVPDCAVLYPADAVSTERLVAAAAYHDGPAYIRTSRPKTAVIYSNDEPFVVGGSKTVRSSATDQATVVGAGVTLYEALKAYDTLKAEGINIRVIDLYSLQPVDAATLRKAGSETGVIITVEDHYPAGGVGDAVATAVESVPVKVERIAVKEIPRSGKPEELLDRYGISAPHIADAVRRAIGAKPKK